MRGRTIVACVALLSSGVVAFPAMPGISLARSAGATVRFDDQRFSGVPTSGSDTAFTEAAERAARSGSRVAERASPDDFLSRSPFRGSRSDPVRVLRIDLGRRSREIVTGRLPRDWRKRISDSKSGWERHASGDDASLEIWIDQRAGRKGIVLVDRDQGTYLDITEDGD